MKILFKRLWRSPTGLAGFILVVIVAVLAVFGPQLSPHNPVKINIPAKLHAPAPPYYLGTDHLGRDILSRILTGTRNSLLVSLTVVAGSAVLGTAIGACSGYCKGKVDETLMRLTDTVMAIPPFLLAMVTVVALGAGVWNAAVALVVVWWPLYARLVRAQVMAVAARPFVEAARSLGNGHWQLIFRHILRNAYPPIMVAMTIDLGQVMLMLAGLSYLGLGAQPPDPDWGLMVSDGRGYMQQAWWYPTFPGVAIAVAVLGFNLLGDFIRDVVDPKLKGVG